MIFDEYGLIRMEKDGLPGDIGDSCAETFRYFHLRALLEPAAKEDNNIRKSVLLAMTNVRTNIGYLRHPLAPEKDDKGANWREPGFSHDQFKAMYMALRAFGFTGFTGEAERRIKSNWYRTGDNNLIHPSYFTYSKRAHGRQNNMSDFPLIAQAYLLLKVKKRWNDEKKELEETKDSSCDWLNFFQMLIQAEMLGHTKYSQKAKEMVTPIQVIEKISSYYASQPNSEWIVSCYDQAVKKVWA